MTTRITTRLTAALAKQRQPSTIADPPLPTANRQPPSNTQHLSLTPLPPSRSLKANPAPTTAAPSPPLGDSTASRPPSLLGEPPTATPSRRPTSQQPPTAAGPSYGSFSASTISVGPEMPPPAAALFPSPNETESPLSTLSLPDSTTHLLRTFCCCCGRSAVAAAARLLPVFCHSWGAVAVGSGQGVGEGEKALFRDGEGQKTEMERKRIERRKRLENRGRDKSRDSSRVESE